MPSGSVVAAISDPISILRGVVDMIIDDTSTTTVFHDKEPLRAISGMRTCVLIRGDRHGIQDHEYERGVTLDSSG
jgi:hypothetical protein